MKDTEPEEYEEYIALTLIAVLLVALSIFAVRVLQQLGAKPNDTLSIVSTVIYLLRIQELFLAHR